MLWFTQLLPIDGLGSLGYDCVEKMQDMKGGVKENCIPCYQEGEVAKVVKEHIWEAIFNSWLEHNPVP